MVGEVSAETHVLSVGGRDITFYKLSPAMLMASRRYLEQLRRKAEEADDVVVALQFYDKMTDSMMDVIDSRFVDEADQTWVAQQMMLGKIDMRDLTAILRNGAASPSAADDDEDVPAKKKPAGRKAAAKKAAAKKTANPTRARR